MYTQEQKKKLWELRQSRDVLANRGRGYDREAVKEAEDNYYNYYKSLGLDALRADELAWEFFVQDHFQVIHIGA